MRFLHTADWQLGMKAAQVGEAGARVREERLHALERVAEAAQANSAEFVLVAGDTFENNGVDRTLVQRVADILSAFGVPVYVIPGNHDPLSPGSVWNHPVWGSIGNLRVLREEEPVEIPGGVLYPCPVRQKRSAKDPTAWIRAGEAGGVRVGVAHGTVEGIRQEEPDYPIPRDAASRAGLDYLALGHWHSTAFYPGQDGVTHMAYSGTHETTSFGERDSGNVLIVEIPGAGMPPVITPVRTGSLCWKVIEEDIRHRGDLLRIRQQVETMENPASTLIGLRISGLLAAEDRDELTRIQEILGSRFLFAHLDMSRIRPFPQDESWVAGLPAGIIRQAGLRLREMADPDFRGERPEGASAEVASRALMELYAMITEGAG
jgi:DNA repair exonuclease SbcCD nuclease subunit